MNDFSWSEQIDQPLDFDSAIADMFASESVEQLLRIFLTNVGEKLNVDRVAVCRAIAPQQLQVLVDAIASDCQTIKDNIYPIHYFGADSFAKFPHDRAITFTDTSQVTQTLIIHQQWQSSHVRALISAPIIFDCPDADGQNEFWGIAIGQCHQPQQWQAQETKFFWAITQALGECLQYWSSLILPATRSPNSDPQLKSLRQFLKGRIRANVFDFSNITNNQINRSAITGNPSALFNSDDQDELQCKRVILDEMSNYVTTPALQDAIDTEISVINSFGIVEAIEVLYGENGSTLDPEHRLNQAINLAMQNLEQYFFSQSENTSNIPDIPNINNESAEADASIDAESKTEENILENISQPHNASDESRIEYLQQKVVILIADLQQKTIEITNLRSQLQKLLKSQAELRQILDNLRSDNLPQSAETAINAIYSTLQTNSISE
jgi:hypothetical protein